MRLSSEYLIVFAVVAELGSVSRAAERLNLSQPAVSGQLKALQELVGEPLYDRHARGISLTEAGIALLPHATAVMRSLSRAAESVLELRGSVAREVRLGVSWSLSGNVVPKMVDKLERQGVNVRLSVRSDHSEALVAGVNSGELHAAVIVDASRNLPEGLEITRFGEEDIRLIVQPNHPQAKAGYIGLQTLADETVLYPMRGSSVRRRIEIAFERANIQPKRTFELGGFLALREALLGGIGVAFLPPSMVRRELEVGWLSSVGIEANGLTLDYGVVAPPWLLLANPTKLVLETILKTVV